MERNDRCTILCKIRLISLVFGQELNPQVRWPHSLESGPPVSTGPHGARKPCGGGESPEGYWALLCGCYTGPNPELSQRHSPFILRPTVTVCSLSRKHAWTPKAFLVLRLKVCHQDRSWGQGPHVPGHRFCLQHSERRLPSWCLPGSARLALHLGWFWVTKGLHQNPFQCSFLSLCDSLRSE